MVTSMALGLAVALMTAPAASNAAVSVDPELQAKGLDGDVTPFVSLIRPADEGPTLVVFATVWCRVCLTEVPHLKAWQDRHDARVLYVMSGTPANRTQSHCRAHGIDPTRFRVVADHKGPIADAFRVEGTPTMYLFEGPATRQGPFTRVEQLPTPKLRSAKSDVILFEDRSRELGTTYFVSVLAPETERARVEKDLAEVRAMTRVLEARLSEWKEDSEISKVNAAAAKGPVKLSKTLTNILAGALKVSAATDGAFDVTWRPLQTLWTEAEARAKLPDAEQIEQAVARVGWTDLELKGSTLRFTKAGMQMGIAGVAKGWIIDAVHSELVRRGHGRVLVNIGGDLRVLGLDERGRSRRMKLADPFRPNAVAATLTVDDVAMATSGNYFRTRQIGAQRIGHIVDPRTGMPPRFEGSVTVLTRDAAMADALATALFVMGPDAGLAFAARTPNVDVVYATRNGIRTTLPDRITPGTMGVVGAD